MAVVVVTMSGHATPLIASWPLTGASSPVVVRATLEAAARRVTRLSMVGEGRPWEAVELVDSDGVAASGRILRERAESLLESSRGIASARVVLDGEDGLGIHVLATAELPREEVARTVETLLEERIGLRVRSDQITVVQSRLSGEELNRVLGRAWPGAPPLENTTDYPQATSVVSSPVVSRVTLLDLHVVSKRGGKQEVGVRIAGGGGSVDGRCLAPAGDDPLLRPFAEATLDAVGRLTQRGRRRAALMLKDVRRFRRRGDEGVVVLVEAKVDGRQTLMSGAAFSADSFERASVIAVLQATNGFVAGDLEIQQRDRPRAGSAGPGDRSPPKPSDAPMPLDASTPSDSSGHPETLRPSDSPQPSDSSGPSDSRGRSGSLRLLDSTEAPAPGDYVSEVLSRIQSTRRSGRTPPESG